jgi:orotidine-5'-phosphate decarboxylase
VQFKQRIEERSRKNHTDIILALDFPCQDTKNFNSLLSRAQTVLDKVYAYICAVKINHHLSLPLGLFEGVQTLVSQAHSLGIQTIMDCKVNDIGSTNQTISEYYFRAGFDALIANPFVGWEDGLKPVFEAARNHDRGVILLTYMSHKGASEGYGQTVIDPATNKKTPQYILFARKALSWGADGAVVGATVPEKIRETRNILGGSVPIYSPGVGAQGGTAEAAREAGSRYIIMGREITQSENPADAVKKLLKI